jgi:hypothetical protein
VPIQLVVGIRLELLDDVVETSIGGINGVMKAGEVICGVQVIDTIEHELNTSDGTSAAAVYVLEPPQVSFDVGQIVVCCVCVEIQLSS